MIQVAMRCHCGTNLIVDVASPYSNDSRWSCHCPDCYDPTPVSCDEGPGARSTCLGYGKTPEAAIADCWEMIEQAWELDYELTQAAVELTDVVELWRQVDAEAERQRGWVWTEREGLDRIIALGKPSWYGPAEVSP